MQLHWLRHVGSSAVFAFVAVVAHASEPGEVRFSTTVKLTVSASENIREPVTSCLARELRALEQVRLVSDQPDWEISVLALEVQSTRGYRGGIAISTVMVSRFRNGKTANLSPPDEKVSSLAQASNLWDYPAHSLNLDASDRLQIMCQQIASDFNARQLEKNRKRLRDAREFPHTEPPAAGR